MLYVAVSEQKGDKWIPSRLPLLNENECVQGFHLCFYPHSFGSLWNTEFVGFVLVLVSVGCALKGKSDIIFFFI